MSIVILMVGLPASGKSKVVESYAKKGYHILSRDKEGGAVIDLLPKMEYFLARGSCVVLDCTFTTKEQRKPFLARANEFNAQVKVHWMTTRIEDCQINALMRMYDRYGKCFLHPSDFKDPIVKNDPNMFPVAVLFKMEKEFEEPTKDEGIGEIIKEKFVRKHREDFTNKALFLDYDSTIREVPSTAKFKFPIKPSQVELMSNTDKIKQYIDSGYLVFGCSNQSCIARNQCSQENVQACFEQTNRQLGIDIQVAYCPHNVPPVCYCRKPQAGLFIPFIMKHKIDVRKSIFVGDQTTDKTAAQRLGLTFAWAENFFDRKKD